ncbi:MAG: leucyl/phenylalanyl-tRNA--protein transferase [Thiomicrorhabdus sp.]|nr:leucyl/phenylalanyl-tRNA--protein transferase [Thiomicrorhabdus sp.]
MQSPPNQSPFWLESTPVTFPPTHLALQDPNGLLAIGGNLTPEWLLHAYSKGIFPWFNPEEPILWWSPNPRSVLFIENLKVKRSLRKTIQKHHKNKTLTVTLDQDFRGVMQACASAPRRDQAGTWITPAMLSAYTSLHQSGHAHSVEVWQNEQLVGGLYGVSIGKMFFGESMFSHITDGSKIALVALAMQLKSWGFKLIDTQVETAHLNSLGAINISREQFETQIDLQMLHPFKAQKWQFSIDWTLAITPHLKDCCTKKERTFS